ncbi:hypothetical protein ACTWQF_29130 [Streptomyces sp. 8N114]|uniref:hypothetical protein n=1 Tax=Streptomyces sp. 8N114 TaxID=3457419 RepID=UPI003FD1992B
MPTDPFRAIAALARAEANRTTPPASAPKPRKSNELTEPSEPTEHPETMGPPESEPEPEPEREPAPESQPVTSERRRTVWRQITRRIRRPDAA